MQTTNAIKKLEKAGFSVTVTGVRIKAAKPGNRHNVRFSDQGGDVVCISIGCEESDAMIDYYPRSYCNSIAQAIKLC
jgi:hypothetical protein